MENAFKRIHVIVMDSVGIGEAPDSAQFDDFDVDTLGHIAREKGGLNLPNLAKLGFPIFVKFKEFLLQISRLPIMEKCRKSQLEKIR